MHYLRPLGCPPRSLGFLLVLVLLMAAWPPAVSPSLAQTSPPWPNGCSVGLAGWAQQGLDAIFNSACDNHDRCWARCNGEAGPYYMLGHRAQCDQTFLSEMTQACALRAAQVALPLGDIDSVTEFISVCEGVALSFYTAVSTPIGTGIYWTSQCLKGCNPEGCWRAGLFFGNPNRPPTCGQFPYTGPGFCYRETVTFDMCVFHQCPGFFEGFDGTKTESEDGPMSKELADQTLQGGECTSPLDWLCCACQVCPNCLL